MVRNIHSLISCSSSACMKIYKSFGAETQTCEGTKYVIIIPKIYCTASIQIIFKALKILEVCLRPHFCHSEPLFP